MPVLALARKRAIPTFVNPRPLVGSLTALAALMALCGGAADAAPARTVTAGALTIVQPWSRATPGGAKTGVGYLVIRNAGDTPDRLTAATAEVSPRVTPHSMKMENGVMVMRALPDGIVVPPHASVTLKPGADHLMMEDLTRPLKRGETFAGTLTFEKAGTVPVTFAVESIGAQGPDGPAKPASMDMK